MAEDLKIIKAVCKQCSVPMEVPVPDYYVRVVKEKCQCGLNSDARVVRYLMFGVAALMACILGCCTTAHYFNTRNIEIINGQGYRIRPPKHGETLFNEPNFIVEKASDDPVPAADKKGPYPDPRAPGVPK